MSPEQLALPIDRKPYFEDWYDRLLAELGRVCTLVTLKEMSFACNAQASSMHQALTNRDEKQRQFQARWLGPFLHRAPDLALANVLVEPAMVEQLTRAKPRTPAEELARLREAMAEVCAPMQLQAINERARR